MNESANINPEIMFNFKQIKPKHSKIASFCDSEFNSQSLGMIKPAEKESDINVGNTHIQDPKIFFLKSSELINIRCTKTIVIKIVNFKCVSQILFDDADDDTTTNFSFASEMGAASSSNAIESCKDTQVSCIKSHYIGVGIVLKFYSGNSKGVSSPHLKPPRLRLVTFSDCNNGESDCGGTENSDVLLVYRVSSFNRNSAVRKLANAPQENGHLPYQNGVHNANNNNANGNVVFHLNDAAENGAAGNVGGNNNGNGGGGRNADGNIIDWLNTITIWRYNVNNYLIETIQMGLYADQFDSWGAFADAIYQCWLQRNANANGNANVIANGNANVIANGNANANALEARVTNPANCWPGSTTLFGRYVDGYFTNLDWPVHEWETVRGPMNCVRLFENNAQHHN